MNTSRLDLIRTVGVAALTPTFAADANRTADLIEAFAKR